MNALKSLVETQTLRDDAGNEEVVVFMYAAPDRKQSQFGNGATLIQIGSEEYRLGSDCQWIKGQRTLVEKWPAFFFRSYGKVAGDARISGRERTDAQETTVVAFTYIRYDFRLWIDSETYRVIQYTMEGPNHHMVSVYSDFDSAPPIEPPLMDATPTPSAAPPAAPVTTLP